MSKPATAKTLKGLYPFLSSKKSDPTIMNQSLLDSIETKVAQHQQLMEDYFESNGQSIVEAASAIAEAYKQ